MTLGQKIKAARIERHMTQKDVVGDYITRNMLSKIENDSATPSVKTLEYLASALGLPAGYFMSDTTGVELTPEAVDKARSAYRDGDYQECLNLLSELDLSGSGYADEVLLLRARVSLAKAYQAVDRGMPLVAKSLISDAIYYNNKTMYGLPAFKCEALLLDTKCCLTLGEGFEDAVSQYHESYVEFGLGENYRLLMTDYYLSTGNIIAANEQMELISDISPTREPEYLLMRGKIEIKEANYSMAVNQLKHAEELAGAAGSKQFMTGLYALLEECYKELEDFKMAYHYATKQLEIKDK